MILTYKDIALLISDTEMFRYEVLELYQRGAMHDEIIAAKRCYNYHKKFTSFVWRLGAQKYPIEVLLENFVHRHRWIPRRVM